MGGSLRSKYYPWSREYFRRPYSTYPTLYPFGAYPYRSSSLDSLELDKYYDSLNLDDIPYTYDPDDQLYSKYKRLAKTCPSNADLLSKLKDFVFEQERQMTTDLLRKISEDRKLRSTDGSNLYRPSRESMSFNRIYDTPLKNDPPFLNPINKKDNFYRRYNSFIKKIMRPLRKSSPVKYEPPKTPRTPRITLFNPPKTNYLSKSYLDDYYYYPTQSYRPYWYRYSSYPLYRRYLYDYDYQPKLQPATVPLDVESIIRKSSNEEKNFKPVKKNYVAPTSTCKYDPFESDSYLRSSLPTWKQYYYTQKLKSKPSNECFLDYYDPYYDFFPDKASVDSTDDLLSNEEILPEIPGDANQLVDEYRDAIYEDIIQNLRQKQLKRHKNFTLRADRKLFGYRANDRVEEERPARSYFNTEPHKNLYRTSSFRISNTYRAAEEPSYPYKFKTYNYGLKNTPTVASACSTNDLVQNEKIDHLKDECKAPQENPMPNIVKDNDKNNFTQPETYYQPKSADNYESNIPATAENLIPQRPNVVSPSVFHSKCATPVDNSFNKYSIGNLSPVKTKNTTWNTDGKLSPRNTTEDTSQDKKLERYRSSNALNKMKPSSTTYEENRNKSDLESRRISDYGKLDMSPTRFAVSETENKASNEYHSFPTKDQQPVDKFTPINSPTKQRPLILDTDRTIYSSENENIPGNPSSSDGKTKPSIADFHQTSNYLYENENISGNPSSIESKTRPSIMDFHQTSNYLSENENISENPSSMDSKTRPSIADFRQTSNYLLQNENTMPENSNSIDSNKYQRRDSLVDTRNDSLTYETQPESRFQRLPSSNDIGFGNREAVKTNLANEYSSDEPKHPNSPTGKKQTRLSTSETEDNRLWLEDRLTQPRRKSSSDNPVQENLRRSSSSRSRQPTPTERTSISRRNSIIYESNKPSSGQSASRRNSIKPVLQRRNSIQPPISEKRNLLQKMNYETKYDGDDQTPQITNENSAKSYGIEEKTETNDKISYQPLTRMQKKLSKDDVFSGVDEQAGKNMDSVKHNAYVADDNHPVYHYDLNSNEEVNAISQKTSAPLSGNYYDENQSRYEENRKDSYGRDVYNGKEQQFYPEYNYNEGIKYDDTNLQGRYYPEQTYQGGPMYGNFDNFQRTYPPGENYPNDQSGYYNLNQSAPLNYIPHEYSSPPEQYQQLPQSSILESYGEQEQPLFVSQSSEERRPRRSFQQLEENAEVGQFTNLSLVRSCEPKEQEQSLNSINEETEKTDNKRRKSITKDATNIQQTSVERTTTAADSTKSKRSVDLGKSSAPPKELSRRASRSTLLSQSSDDRKFKNQFSAGELQKRMSKPKIGESKLRRTASTFKVKPTGAAKKT